MRSGVCDVPQVRELADAAGKVVSRRSLIDSVWGVDCDIKKNTLDAFMRLLRNKIDPPGRAKLIHTVRGVGYMIRPIA